MTNILTPQQAARLKKIKLAAAKVKAENKRKVRDRIEELSNAKLPNITRRAIQTSRNVRR